MTTEQLMATLQDIVRLLDSSIKNSIDATGGPKVIRIIHRQFLPTEDLTDSNLVASAANEIGAYLAAWPNVDALKCTEEFTSATAGVSKIYHLEKEADNPWPSPSQSANHATAGNVDALIFRNHRVKCSELQFVVTCSVPA